MNDVSEGGTDRTDHSFRDLETVDAELDWSRNTSGRSALPFRENDVSEGGKDRRDHDHRGLEKVDASYDFQRNAQDDNALPLRPNDVSVPGVDLKPYSFRDIEVVDPELDWSRGTTEWSALLTRKNDVSQGGSDIREHDHRGLEVLDAELDFQRSARQDATLPLRMNDVSEGGSNRREFPFRALENVDPEMDWSRNTVGQSALLRRENDVSEGGKGLTVPLFRTLNRVDVAQDWLRGGMNDAPWDQDPAPWLNPYSEPHDASRRFDRVDADLDFRHGGSGSNANEREAYLNGGSVYHEKQELVRNYDRVDADQDWQHFGKDASDIEQTVPSAVSEGEVASYTFRKLSQIDPLLDFQPGGNRPELFNTFVPDLDRGDRDAGSKIRQLSRLDPQLDWLHPSAEDPGFSQALAPDLTPMASHPNSYAFRKYDKVDPSLDWHFGPNADMAIEREGDKLALQETYMPQEEPKFRQTSKIDRSIDWQRGNTGEKAWKEQTHMSLGTYASKVNLERNFAHIHHDVDFRGSSKADPMLSAYSFGPDLTVTPRQIEFRPLSKLDSSVDWQRSARETDDVILRSPTASHEPWNAPANLRFRQLDNVDPAVDWQRNSREVDSLDIRTPALSGQPWDGPVTNQRLRELQSIDHTVDWHAGKNSKMLKQFPGTVFEGGGVGHEKLPDNHKPRWAHAAPGMRFNMAAAGRQFSSFEPDVTPPAYLAERFGNHEFRGLARLGAAVDWLPASQGDFFSKPAAIGPPPSKKQMKQGDAAWATRERAKAGGWAYSTKIRPAKLDKEPDDPATAVGSQDKFISEAEAVGNFEFRYVIFRDRTCGPPMPPPLPLPHNPTINS